MLKSMYEYPGCSVYSLCQVLAWDLGTEGKKLRESNVDVVIKHMNTNHLVK